MMLVKARVFRGDDGVLEIGRDLAQRNKLVAFVIRSVVDPGLHSALDMNRGRRRIDPADGDKKQGGEQPKKERADKDPSKEGYEQALSRFRLEAQVWPRTHSSE
jgi:hypothetical protein